MSKDFRSHFYLTIQGALNMGKISQYQNIRVLLEYQDSRLTNAKCRLVSGFSQLQLQKTKLQHNSTLQ